MKLKTILASAFLGLAAIAAAQEENSLLTAMNPLFSAKFRATIELSNTQMDKLRGVLTQGLDIFETARKRAVESVKSTTDKEEQSSLINRIFADTPEAIAAVVDPKVDQVLDKNQEVFYSATVMQSHLSSGRMFCGYAAKRLRLTSAQIKAIERIDARQKADLKAATIQPDSSDEEIQRLGAKNKEIMKGLFAARIALLDERQKTIIGLAMKLKEEKK